MNRLAFLVTLTGLLTLLSGCGGQSAVQNMVNASQARLNVATTELYACFDAANAQAPSYRAQKIISGHDDPQKLSKMTDTEEIPQDYKDFAIQRDTLYILCETKYLQETSMIDPRLSAMYAENFSALRLGVARMLTGEVKTWGQYNKEAMEEDLKAQAKSNEVFAILNKEIAQARQVEKAEQERLDAQRRRDAEIAMANYNNSMKASNDAFNEYVKSLGRQMDRNQFNMRQTNCRWIGNTWNCTSY